MTETPGYPMPFRPDPSGKLCWGAEPGPTWTQRSMLALASALIEAGATTGTAQARVLVAREARLLAAALLSEYQNPTTGDPQPVPPRPAPPASPARVQVRRKGKEI